MSNKSTTNDLRQDLFLIADEMRSLASASHDFADNPYEVDRAERLMALAARLANLAEGDPLAEADIASAFTFGWSHMSPAIGVDAFVLNAHDEVLLVNRRDNERWAMPGGLADVGETLAEAVLRELWEEAGLRGQASRLLAIFDGRLWGSRSKFHIAHLVFLVECDDPRPVPGTEMLDARFFLPDSLPELMHYGHRERLLTCLESLERGFTYFDPAASYDAEMPMHQRPVE